MFVRNTRLWSICSTLPRYKCYQPKNIGLICSALPLQVMKLVRLRLSVLCSLLEEENTKIIWLVRDPRAVINSRLNSVNWCDSIWCKNPKYLCNDMIDDYNSFLHIKQKYPSQIILLRYEDLAASPYDKVNELFNFLNLPMDNSTTKYLDLHLSGEFEAPWSTVHNPKVQSKKWLKIIDWNTIVQTQYYCRPFMKKLGYIAFNKEKDRYSENFIMPLDIFS